ncbi:MAG: TonB-dependent receptor [Janthinobacterium lividum]
MNHAIFTCLLLLGVGAGQALAQTSPHVAPAALAPTTPVAPMTAPAPVVTTVVAGTVRDAADQPLPGASVFLKTTFDGASTDSLGTFRFTTTHTGSLTLVSSLMTYTAQEQVVALAGQPVQVDFRLKVQRNVLDNVVVTAGSFDTSLGKRSTVFKPLDILVTPGGAADITAALNTLPGTTRVGEEGKLFVRGGAANETRFYFDGLPVPVPYRGSVAGVPSRTRFAPTLFRGTALSTGGYSAEYGQALSSVVALNSVELEPETQTKLSLLSVGGSVSHAHRWANTSLNLTGDYTNLEPYYRLVPQALSYEVAPRLLGAALNLRHRLANLGMLKLYANHSGFNFTLLQPYPGEADQQRVVLQNTNDFINASYRGELRHGWSLQTGVSATADEQAVRPGAQYVHTLDRSVVARAVLLNDSVAWPGSLKIGGEGFLQRYEEQYQPSADQAMRRLGFTEQRGSAFTEATYSPTARLTAIAGARTEYSGVLGRWNAAPRLSLAYQVSDHGQVSGAWGFFYQNPDKSLLRVAPRLAFERAQHLLLNYELTRHNRTLRTEVYYKRYTSLTTFDGNAPYNPASYQNAGSGYAQGFDVLLRDNQTLPNGDYSLSYSFLDTNRRFLNYPESAIPTFAARHSVVASGKYLYSRLHTQFGASFTYNSPRRYFDPNQPGFNQASTPPFEDLSLSATYITSLWRQFTVVNLSVSNVLGRDNVYGYNYANLPDANGHYVGVPVIPAAPRLITLALVITLTKQHLAPANPSSLVPEP